jgi:hypothetical protein
MSVVDDYGRYHGSPLTIRAGCWPTCPEKINHSEVVEWLKECTSGDKPLIQIYSVDGAKYLQITDFKQQTRTRSKFPESEIGLISDCEQNVFTSRSRSRISETETEAARACEINQPSSGENPAALGESPGVPGKNPRMLADSSVGRADRFSEFIAPWPRVANPDHAARAWISCIDTPADEGLAFAARDRYLSSDEVSRGVVSDPAKWLMDQKSAKWGGKWPPAVQRMPNGKQTAADRALQTMIERAAKGERPA